MHKSRESRTYYVVVHGRKPGIYKDNQKAIAQVHNFPFGKMKKVKGLKAAKAYFSKHRQTDAENKVYYVVKRGRNPGLYLDKNKALQQIKNFSYGKMKRIKGYENARAYFHGKQYEEKEKIPYIYIDGSYVQHDSFSGYGFVAVENDRILVKDGGAIFDYDIINLHSSGAELYALIRAIEWAMANSYKFVRIIYDSESVIQLAENDQLKANGRYPRGKVKLANIYAQYKHYIAIDYAHKSEQKYYEKYHQQAHDLSRMMNVLEDANSLSR